MNSKKKLNYQSVIMTEVMNFVGISFNVCVHMWAEVLKQLLLSEFSLLLWKPWKLCSSEVIL